jgi:hypothetical protein
VLECTAAEAQHDRPLPRPHRLDGAEGNGTVPPRKQASPANDDLVGAIGVALVTDVVEPAEMRAVASYNSVPLGGGEQATELRLPPQGLLGTLIPDPLGHRREA